VKKGIGDLYACESNRNVKRVFTVNNGAGGGSVSSWGGVCASREKQRLPYKGALRLGQGNNEGSQRGKAPVRRWAGGQGRGRTAGARSGARAVRIPRLLGVRAASGGGVLHLGKARGRPGCRGRRRWRTAAGAHGSALSSVVYSECTCLTVISSRNLNRSAICGE
jgi:hypothetical protein